MITKDFLLIIGFNRQLAYLQTRTKANHVQKDWIKSNLEGLIMEIKSNSYALIWKDLVHICYPNTVEKSQKSEKLKSRLEAFSEAKTCPNHFLGIQSSYLDQNQASSDSITHCKCHATPPCSWIRFGSFWHHLNKITAYS